MSTSYTLIDYFNGFQQLKRIKRLSAGVQSTYFAILAEFNLRRFPAELELSTRDLKSLAGLKSVSSAHEARNILKNNKLVDFHTKNGISTYSLGTEHLPNTNRTATERYPAEMPNTNRTPHALSSSSVLSTQMETETKRQEEDLSINHLSTGARDTSELDTILEYWERDLRGGRLSFEHQGQIAAWLEQHGYEWLKAAMREASDTNGNSHGLNFKLLRGVVERKLNPPQKPELRLLKGGETNGGQSEYRYEPLPASTGNEPWAGY